MKDLKTIFGVLGLVFLLAGITYAQPVTKPHTFVPGTPAQAEEVNENFDVLYQKINELANQLSQLSQNADSDGDGYSQILDCDDNNSSIYPGAEEICGNGVDDDCDQEIDDGCTSCTPGDPCGNNLGECVSEYDADCNCVAVQGPTSEVCDGLDNACTGVVDDGTLASMCPTPFGARVVGCVSGECELVTCSPDHYDVDGDYQTGCECIDGPASHSCSISTGPLSMSQGDLPITTNGVLMPDTFSPSSTADWYEVRFLNDGNFCPDIEGNPQITLTGSNAGNFTFSLFANCSGLALEACPPGGCIDMQSWSNDDYYDNVQCTIAWPLTVLVRVDYNGPATNSCADLDYQLTIER